MCRLGVYPALQTGVSLYRRMPVRKHYDFTLSQDDASSKSLVLLKMTREIPSVGGDSTGSPR